MWKRKKAHPEPVFRTWDCRDGAHLSCDLCACDCHTRESMLVPDTDRYWLQFR